MGPGWLGEASGRRGPARRLVALWGPSWCRRAASGFIFQECESFPLAGRRELKFNSGGAAPPTPRPPRSAPPPGPRDPLLGAALGPGLRSPVGPLPLGDARPWVVLARGVPSPVGLTTRESVRPISWGSYCPGVVVSQGSHHPGVALTQRVPSPRGPIAQGSQSSPGPLTSVSPCPWVTLARGIHHPWVLLPVGTLTTGPLGHGSACLWVPLTRGCPYLWVPSPQDLLSTRSVPREAAWPQGHWGERGHGGAVARSWRWHPVHPVAPLWLTVMLPTGDVNPHPSREDKPMQRLNEALNELVPP